MKQRGHTGSARRRCVRSLRGLKNRARFGRGFTFPPIEKAPGSAGAVLDASDARKQISSAQGAAFRLVLQVGDRTLTWNRLDSRALASRPSRIIYATRTPGAGGGVGAPTPLEPGYCAALPFVAETVRAHP